MSSVAPANRPWPTLARSVAAVLFALAPLLVSAQSNAVDSVGTVAFPEPTFQHITIDWPITGDANNNSIVSVRFRAVGASNWRQGMPLRRVPAGSTSGFSWANRHSGSLFGLQPATSYQVELQLTDPDGGSFNRQHTVSTRSPMQSFASGTVRQATPSTLSSVLNAAQPGDTVVLGAGNYAGFNLNRDGTAERPLTLRAAAAASINGELGLFYRRHVILQDLLVNGRIRLNGSSDVAVRNSTVNASATEFNGDTIVCFLRCERLHIADNTLNGTTQWNEAALGVNGNNRGEGVVVTGPGHVVERNTVTGFRDGISFLEGSEAVDQYSIDVLENFIDISGDDAIEADFCAHNCRIIGNRAVNSFIAFSSQPSLGGPTYFIRNVAFNVIHVAFKLYRTSYGDVLLHNTVIKNGDAFAAYPGVPIHRLYARNNLFLGGPGGSWGGYSSGSGRVIDLATLVTSGSSSNYNGYGSENGFTGRYGSTQFSGLAQLRSSTTELQSQQISRATVFAASVPYPSNPMTRYSLPDLRLAAGTSAIGSAEPIPNINDGYAGTGPDLGAFELAEATPPPPPPPPPGRIFGDGFGG
ncbi:MAG: hypothetical protein MEQ07_00065 [Aquimonas sp.]|nr:hypothetical protein [Aquimonas sp.]